MRGEEIVAAYRNAQELYENGTLPQRKQLLNLYLHKVVVYPEYVEIHINNVPTNILKPSQMHEDPALSGVLSYRFNGSAPAKTGKRKGSQKNDEFIISLAPAGGGEGSWTLVRCFLLNPLHSLNMACSHTFIDLNFPYNPYLSPVKFNNILPSWLPNVYLK